LRELSIYKSDPVQSIYFEEGKELKLRPSISFHFFANYLINLNDCGVQQLSKKAPSSRSKVSKKSSSFLSMSTADKLLKWNTVGVQGAALSLFIKPVFIKSFIFAGTSPGTKMEYALGARVPPINSFSEGYGFHLPVVDFLKEVEAFNLLNSTYSPGDRPGIVWNAVTSEFETLNCSTGLTLDGNSSNISRCGLYTDLCDIWAQFSRDPLPVNYAKIKQASLEYQHNLQRLKEVLAKNNLGMWLRKCQ